MRRLIGGTLLGLGVLFLLLSLGTLTAATWAEWQHLRAETTDGPREALPARLAASTTPTPRAVPTARDRGLLPTVAPWFTPSPVPPPSYGSATWIAIPAIGVESRIMEVGVVDGAYVVPAWEIGHHHDSANPGEPGNAVFTGHVQTINAGRVFVRLADLRPGDAVYVYTGTHRLDWVVNDIEQLPNTDTGFYKPGGETRLTLYTCIGRFDPVTRDYSERLVATAHLVGVLRKG